MAVTSSHMTIDKRILSVSSRVKENCFDGNWCQNTESGYTILSSSCLAPLDLEQCQSRVTRD